MLSAFTELGWLIRSFSGQRIDVEQAGVCRRRQGIDGRSVIFIANTESQGQVWIHLPAILEKVCLTEVLRIVNRRSEVARSAAARAAEIIQESSQTAYIRCLSYR